MTNKAFLGHIFPGAVFFLMGCGMFIYDPLSQNRALLGDCNKTAIVGFMISSGAAITYLLTQEMWIHRVHHATMFTGYAVTFLVHLLESRGRMFAGSGSLCLSLAFLSEAMMFMAHAAPTELETRSHYFLVVTAIVASAAALRWAMQPICQTARTAMLFATAFHGLLFMNIGIWLGFFFYYPVWRDPIKGNKYDTPAPGATELHYWYSFGPYLNTSTDLKVWHHDRTTGHHIMQLHVLVAMNLLLMGFTWMMRMNCAYRAQTASELEQCSTIHANGAGEVISIMGKASDSL